MNIKKGKISVTISIAIACFLLAMIIFMQFKIVYQTEQTELSSMRETDLRTELTNWKNKYDETKSKYNETLKTLESYKQENSTDGKTKEKLQEEIQNLELALGKTDVKGEGVIITIREKNLEELGEDEDIISIKAEDLYCIVNYLKDAGAEAISINDERVVNTTDIVDIGEKLIKINSKYLRENVYVIKAIGNSSYLESSIFGKGGYAEQLMTTGIKATIEKQNKVEILKYEGNFDTKYMEEVN